MTPEANNQADFYVPATRKDGLATSDKQYQEMLFHEVFVKVIGTSATLVDVTQDLVTTTGGQPQYLRDGCYITIEPRDADVYVRFGPSNGGAAATTSGDASNGERIPAGSKAQYWLPGAGYQMCDIISAAASNSVAFRRSSARRGHQNAPGQPGS